MEPLKTISNKLRVPIQGDGEDQKLPASRDEQSTQEKSILLNSSRQFSRQAAIFPSIHALSRQTGWWSGPWLSFTEFREILFFATEIVAWATQLQSENE
jgi:hypothetical protein